MVSFKVWLKRNKEGAFLGGLAGAIITWYAYNTGVVFNIPFLTQGILDNFLNENMEFKRIILTKVGVFLVVLGSGLGALIDNKYKPRR